MYNYHGLKQHTFILITQRNIRSLQDSHVVFNRSLQEENMAGPALMSDEQQTSFVPLGDVVYDV